MGPLVNWGLSQMGAKCVTERNCSWLGIFGGYISPLIWEESDLIL